MEHHVVMEQLLGRPLRRDERVHHKNGVRSDNAPGNLELWVVLKKDPAGQRISDLAIDLLQRMTEAERALVFAAFGKL